MKTRDEAVAAAGRLLAEAVVRRDCMTPEEIAAEAYVPGGPTREQLAARIRNDRAAQLDAA